MAASTEIAALRRLAQVLLDAASPRDALEDAATALYDLLLAASGLEGSEADPAGTALRSGRALSPVDAALCTRDPVRTAVFLRGVNGAIEAVREGAGGRPVAVVYAGTGPLAPLVLPLLPRFRPGELSLTLLDVHERSVASVRRLVERFDLGAHVRSIVAADATEYDREGGAPVDVVVVETMQRSLGVEPQVAITRHLAGSLAPGGVLVPERTRVDLVLSDPEFEAASGCEPARAAAVRVPAGPVFELTRESALSPVDEEGRFPPVTVTLPSATGRGRQAMLFTTVVALGPHVLAPGDSGLTVPEVLWQVPALPAGARLQFRYRLGPRPGLEWSLAREGPGGCGEGGFPKAPSPSC